MSQEIKWDHPLTEQERRYLHERGQHQLVEKLDAEFPAVADDAEALGGSELPDDNYDDTKAWKVDDLREELGKRGLSTEGKRDELISRLRESDAQPEQ